MLQYQIDSHFIIGQQHVNSGKLCQDYALTGESFGKSYGVLCDGCSSGGRTELGAAIIASYIDKLYRLGCSNFVNDELWKRISYIGYGIGLKNIDLLSTVGYLVADNLGIYATLYGDGVIVAAYKDGRITACRAEWDNNTPYYPMMSDKQSFIDYHKDNELPFKVETTSSYNNSIWTEGIDSAYTYYNINSGMKGINRYFFPYDMNFVGIFSDGVCQISGVDWKDAVRELIAFKNPVGEFVKRRVIKMVKNGYHPLDDLSCIALHVNTNQEE